MNFTIGFSPCPNDTFIFDALINGKIDTEGLRFIVSMEDVETLNKDAIKGKLDITKMSYGILPLVLDKYVVLNSGSALGQGVGPLLISYKDNHIYDINSNEVAIPGEHTTAHLLFSLAYPDAKNRIFLRYDEIEDYVLSRKGLGVIIHENRFTYQQKGLYKVTELGEYWENKTRGPVPLGGIIIKRNIATDLQKKVDQLIKKSIEYAYSQYPVINEYIRSNSQELEDEIILKHIDLYVNDYSKDLGLQGKTAVKKMIEIYSNLNGIKVSFENIFV